MKNIFCHNLLRSFYIWCQFEAVFNFQNFKNVRDIEVPTNFFIGFDTGSWIYQQDRHAYFRYFELLIVAQAEILMEIHKLFYLWPGYVTNDVINTDLNKCSHNTMIHIDRNINDDIFVRFLVVMKNVVISFIKEYSGPTLRPPSDVIDDVIITKILFWRNLGRPFHIWGQMEAVINISKFSKLLPFPARDKLFLLAVIPEVEYSR